MKDLKMVGLIGLALTIIFNITLFLQPTQAEAKPKIVAIEGMSYKVNHAFSDNLKSLIGKNVYVTLDSGKIFSGSVKEVGNNLVHLEKLAGKEYFDALIKIEDISAIDARFRVIER